LTSANNSATHAVGLTIYSNEAWKWYCCRDWCSLHNLAS